MNWASSEVVATLTFLLPGFIAAAVFYSLTSHPKPGAFDRIVVALIFTLVGQTITEIIFQQPIDVKYLSPALQGWQAALPIFVAVCLGLFATTITNNDWLHKPLRFLRITRENSYPSEWFSAFDSHGDGCYVVLHLTGERRLYGYAEEWPSDPNVGHFRVAEAEWLKDGIEEEQKKGDVSFSRVVSVLIPASEVIIVEFVPMNGEQSQEID